MNNEVNITYRQYTVRHDAPRTRAADRRVVVAGDADNPARLDDSRGAKAPRPACQLACNPDKTVPT